MKKLLKVILTSLFILILTGSSVLAMEGTKVKDELDTSVKKIVDSHKTKGAILAVADEYNDIPADEATTYSKIPVLEYGIVQNVIILAFAIFVVSCFIVEIYVISKGKSDKYRKLILLCSGFQLLAFLVLVALVHKGLVSFSLLNLINPIRCCVWLIISTSLIGVLCSFYMNARYNRLIPITIIWNFISIAFCIGLTVFNFV